MFPSLENPNGIAQLPGMPELTVGDLPTFMLPFSPPHFRLWVAEFVSVLDKVKWVLGNSVNELEEETVNSLALVKPIYPIGPLVSPILLGKEETVEGSVDMWRAQDYCIEWLNKQEPSSVIYVSFGSIIMSSENQIHSIALALKNIKRPFRWVVKASNARKDEFPSGFLEEIKKEKWVAYPEWTDQPTNSKLLVDFFKIGVRMRNRGEEGLSVEEVERCIMEVTDGAGAREMKRRAMELKEAAKKALGDAGSSNRNIDRFISEIMENHTAITFNSSSS
ncbi:Detected protein of unknown function [Hibiscus syriacus]|uniref:Uncharacterized protein n=1 Tax=Hibiscus syriacus TaxID=106335 RepID=A0A6A3C247_HIBSY|nr:Detected protein of unknown function [Hibiscus syriacus]